MIKKCFSELSLAEKENLYKFLLKSNIESPSETYKEFIENFCSIIFEYGKSLFCFWDNYNPVATIGTIVKDIIYKGEAFVTAVNVHDDYISQLEKFWISVEEYILGFHPKVIKLGINYQKREFVPVFENLGFGNPYETYILKYLPEPEKDLGINENISFENLGFNNKDIFKKINNSAFSDSPNGGIISEKEVIDYFEKYKEKPDLIGIFKIGEQTTGTYELTISNSTGFIESIGISPDFQGKGFGKLLLQASINKLLKHGAKEIKLSVVSTNEKALNLYRKYGFEEDKIASVWLSKNVSS